MKKRQEIQKKQPPPRPPPPKFNRYKSASSYNLSHQSVQTQNLIEWSPPSSPGVGTHQQFGGSICSSYSSSASSLSSNKKSTDGDFSFLFTLNWGGNPTSNEVQINSVKVAPVRPAPSPPQIYHQRDELPSIRQPIKKDGPKPTIIRAAPSKCKSNKEDNKSEKNITSTTPINGSPPMPKIPPPSPPKGDTEIITPYGIALFNYPQSQPEDLALQVDDVVLILKRIDKDWLYGRVDDREGMFPESYINIEVPLPGERKVVTALYEFNTNITGDLKLVPGQKIRIIRRINEDWLYGESNGEEGQFPSNFIV